MTQPARDLTRATPTEHPHILRTPGICGGRPHIAGTRISVRSIAELHRAGESVAEISATYPQVEPAALYDAISYYLDHRPEIETEIQANRLEVAASTRGARLDDGIVRFDEG